MLSTDNIITRLHMTQDNVVPGEARAVVNHRIHPTETLDDILKHDKKVINDDRVEIKTLGYFPPPSISPYSNDVSPFQIVANSALQVESSAIFQFAELLFRSSPPATSPPAHWWPTRTQNITSTSQTMFTGRCKFHFTSHILLGGVS